MAASETNMNVVNRALFVCQSESNRWHLADVWAFIAVHLQHIPCNRQTVRLNIYQLARLSPARYFTTTTNKIILLSKMSNTSASATHWMHLY